MPDLPTTDDESVCMCGHAVDEHNGSGECQVEDCDCFCFEPNEEAFLA